MLSPNRPTMSEDIMDDIKILLVDDEEDFIRTLSERLDLRDLGSKTALNGE